MADEHDIGGKTEKAPEIPGRPSRPSAAAERPTEDRAVAARGEAQVNDLRRRIDQIDDQLMKLLNSRSACAVEIGRIKRHIGMPVYQPEREKWILDRVERNNPGPLDSGAVRRVFERVIDESRRLERLAREMPDPPPDPMHDPPEGRVDLGAPGMGAEEEVRVLWGPRRREPPIEATRAPAKPRS